MQYKKSALLILVEEFGVSKRTVERALKADKERAVQDDNRERLAKDAPSEGQQTLDSLTETMRGLRQEPLGVGNTYADLPAGTRVVSLPNGEFLLAPPERVSGIGTTPVYGRAKGLTVAGVPGGSNPGPERYPGPEPNTFSGRTKAEAEANRDAYAAAHPEWQAAYDADSRYYCTLLFD